MSVKDGTIKNTAKSQFEVKKQFEDFLRKHKVEGKGTYHTHTAFGPPYGKFNISEDDYTQFYDLYCNALQRGVDLHITERPKEVGPLLIDIDFHFDENHDERIYKDDDIRFVIGHVNSVVRKYYKWDSKSLSAFVFEKEKPSKRENKDQGTIEYKDGFHIVYPFLGATIGMRYLILHNIKTKISETNGFGHIPYINSIDEVFDMSIIKNNGWMMYGSRKDNGPWYMLTHIYSCTFDDEDRTRYRNRDLVKILGNRKYNDEQSTPYKETIDQVDLENQLNEILRLYGVIKNDGKKNKNTKSKNPFRDDDIEFDDNDDNDEDCDNVNNDDEYIEDDVDSIRTEILNRRKEQNKKKELKDKNKEVLIAKKVVKIMSKERAIKYSDWVKVGWALHNVSDTLLDTFKEFSKKAGKGYNEQSCEDVWKNARNEGFTIASLRHWANIDSPDRYYEIMTESVNELIVEAESGTEYDVAKVVYELYKDQYKCTSIKNNVWYEFQRHRWIEVEGGYTLSTKISEELTKEFAILNSTYLQQMGHSKKNMSRKGQDSDALLKRAENVLKIMLNLKKSGFKKRVLEECKIQFYDAEFEEKLDSNRNLVGFNNGVYDLEAGCFRAGVPDDLVSLTVGYDYKEYTLTHEHIVGIKDFFCKVQPEEIMREYILTLMSSYLDGHTKKEQFVIWTGSGCHAAGTPIRMYDGTLKNVEDIEVLDKLMGDDYKPRIIKHLYGGKDKMYRVTQTDGMDYIVNGAHRLALKFTGQQSINYNENKNRYEIKWYEAHDELAIRKVSRYFESNEVNEANKFYENLPENGLLIPHNHLVVMTVNTYLQLQSNIKDLLNGYKAQLNETTENEVNYKLNEISIEYVGEDNYYGFEITGNQRYLMMDGTVTCNSNGKSKSVELFQLAFGDYCGVMPITVLTKKRGSSGQATPELAEMKGKRFVVFQEPENNDEIQVGFMKELTGGDWIYARPLFRDPIRYKPQFKLLLTCNKLPFIPSTDGGTWRRLRVSPWESEFVDDPKLAHQFKKDYELLEKLELWKEAFLWYLLNVYYPKYKKDGLNDPAKVTKFTNNYKKQSDIFFEFIDSNLTLTKNNKDIESFEILYAALKQWYSDSYSTRCPFAKKDLINYLSNNNYKTDASYLYGARFKSEDNKSKDIDD